MNENREKERERERERESESPLCLKLYGIVTIVHAQQWFSNKHLYHLFINIIIIINIVISAFSKDFQDQDEARTEDEAE